MKWPSVFGTLRVANASKMYRNIVRHMAIYPDTHAHPVLPDSVDEQQRTEISFVPVRAATNDFHMSFMRDPLLQKFINVIMIEGRKENAFEAMCRTFATIKHHQLRRRRAIAQSPSDASAQPSVECCPHQVFHEALRNCQPQLRLLPVIRSGRTYQVPRAMPERRAVFTAMMWLRNHARSKHSRQQTFHHRLAMELVRAANNEGAVVKQKHELHRQCEANRAYSHFMCV